METTDRELNGVIIRQRTCDKYFCLNDATILITKWKTENGKGSVLTKPEKYFSLDSTKSFIEIIKMREGVEPHIRSRGRGKLTWIHPHLFLDYLLWGNPHFKYEVYSWIMDNLIKNRIKSGDSWTKMKGVLHEHCKNKAEFSRNIAKLAQRIRELIGFEGENWSEATSAQLEMRDKLHELIADLAETLHDSQRGTSLALKTFKNKLSEVTQ